MRQLLLIIIILTGCNKTPLSPDRGSIVEAVYGLGIIKSDNTYHARAAIITSISEFFVNEGQDVRKNQKLFVTDQGAIYSAPFSGKITDRPIGIGENLFPQTVILSLIDLEHLYLEVSLEQQSVMRLKKGISAEVTFDFFRNNKISGVISSIYPKNDQFVARVLLQKWPSGVLPGMSADVAFEVARKHDALLVPTVAIANGHIHIKRNGKKMKLKIKAGLSDEDKTEILSPKMLITDEIFLP